MPPAGPLATYLRITPRSPEEQVLRLLIELGAQIVDAAEGSLLVYDQRRHDLVFALTVGDRLSERTLQRQRVPIGDGITGLAALTREVQIGAPTWKGFRQAARGKGGRRATVGGGDPAATIMAAPMLVQDQLVGVITAVSFDKAHRFTRAHGTLYGRMATVAGLIVHQRAQLETRSRQKGDSVAATAERQAMATLGRIALKRPAAMRAVADTLMCLERMLEVEPSR